MCKCRHTTAQFAYRVLRGGFHSKNIKQNLTLSRSLNFTDPILLQKYLAHEMEQEKHEMHVCLIDAKATGNSLLVITGNCYVLNLLREFLGISLNSGKNCVEFIGVFKKYFYC